MASSFASSSVKRAFSFSSWPSKLTFIIVNAVSEGIPHIIIIDSWVLLSIIGFYYVFINIFIMDSLIKCIIFLFSFYWFILGRTLLNNPCNLWGWTFLSYTLPLKKSYYWFSVDGSYLYHLINLEILESSQVIIGPKQPRITSVMPESKSFSCASVTFPGKSAGLPVASALSAVAASWRILSRVASSLLSLWKTVEYSVLSWDGYKAPQHPVLSLNFSLLFLLGVWNTQFFLCFPWKAIPSIKSFSCSLLGLFIIGFDLGPRFSK